MKSASDTFEEAFAGPTFMEGPVWQGIRGTWQPLHGSYDQKGLSVEWHDFLIDRELNWAESFHPGSMEICLNFRGNARLSVGKQEQALAANELALYSTQRDRIRAVREPGSMHRFITLEISRNFLRSQFSELIGNLKRPVQQFLEGDRSGAFLERQPLPASLLAARAHFIAPPVPEAARDTWYLGRVLEILAQTVFSSDGPQEMFCERHRRTNRERVERAQYLISRDLENPPSLDMLAAEVHCSPFYLSRVFAQELGVSIPKFLRMKRIERAAAMIASGAANVTAAAMAVGYSSLSAFNKAFVEQMGCCPGLYNLV